MRQKERAFQNCAHHFLRVLHRITITLVFELLEHQRNTAKIPERIFSNV